MKKRFLLFSLLAGMLSSFFFCSNLPVLTPLEKTGYREFSTYDAMEEYLAEMQELAPSVNVEQCGKSVKGRNLYLVSFEQPEKAEQNRVKFLLYCQQHGNEVSGKDASLNLIREIALGELGYLLDRIDMKIIPCVNPDGSERYRRRNAHNIDLNRNHLIITEPEIKTLHSLFTDFMPEVALDVHEYSGYTPTWVKTGFLKAMDTQIGGPTNLNISQDIRTYAQQKIIPYIDDQMAKEGYYFHRYLVGGPPKENRVRYSTTAVNDGRSSMAMYNTLSFILEGRKSREPVRTLKRLVNAQFKTITALLKYTYDHHSEIKNLVQANREKLSHKSEGDPLVLRMEYIRKENDPTLIIPVYMTRGMKAVRKEYFNFTPAVSPLLTTTYPAGYILPGTDIKLRNLLDLHTIEYTVLDGDTEFLCEVFTIDSLIKVREEDKPLADYALKKTVEKRTFPAGTITVPITQMRSALIGTMLEPRSQSGIAQYKDFQYLFQPGKEYPIIRYITHER